MLEEMKAALEPQSLLEIVPREILQSLMQGFFFGQRAGMVLIYDHGIHPNGELILERLEPVEVESAEWRARSQNFNPFCAKFRETPEHDVLCEACDLRRARSVFSGSAQKTRYVCHMGLFDMTIPINVNGRIRGVLIGGQKILDDPGTIQTIRLNIGEKASEDATVLEELLQTGRQSKPVIDTFEQSFRRFAEGVQKTVDVFVTQRQDEAERNSLLRIAEEVGRAQADDLDSFGGPATKLLAELEALLGGAPVWMFLRRGSRYECIAASPKAEIHSNITLPVSLLIQTRIDEPELLADSSRIHTEISQKLGLHKTPITLVRTDNSISQTEVVSVIAVIGTQLPSRHSQFIVGCVGAIAYPAGVILLFMKLDKQQKDFERAALFTGHHLKTSLQMVRLDIEEAMLLRQNDLDVRRQLEVRISDN